MKQPQATNHQQCQARISINIEGLDQSNDNNISNQMMNKRTIE